MIAKEALKRVLVALLLGPKSIFKALSSNCNFFQQNKIQDGVSGNLDVDSASGRRVRHRTFRRLHLQRERRLRRHLLVDVVVVVFEGGGRRVVDDARVGVDDDLHAARQRVDAQRERERVAEA